ncbi:hypothetical protein K239x_07010 [Planctomycetes bacterium K23_9]|uniref:Uncharacterized protein n=1 Tax=Stieleria marina TaxID=1930275 RepID=A0A517NNQ3_9BACT|nr:hypothetical protein K239x_07010 [Planctomycetes bacterium K23_9]
MTPLWFDNGRGIAAAVVGLGIECVHFSSVLAG